MTKSFAVNGANIQGEQEKQRRMDSAKKERSEQMVTMTLSFKTWCLRYHREIYSLLMFGHVELLTDDMKKEYLKWCRTDEGKKYLEGGEEYLKREE